MFVALDDIFGPRGYGYEFEKRPRKNGNGEATWVVVLVVPADWQPAVGASENPTTSTVIEKTSLGPALHLTDEPSPNGASPQPVS